MPIPNGVPLVAADVGNSSTKYLLGELVDSFTDAPHIRACWDQCRSKDFREPLETLDVPANAHWFVSSVNSHNMTALKRHIEQQGVIASWHVIQRSEIPLELDVETPHAVGLDRLLAALAAKERAGDQQDVIVIDCGTALTIDVVTSTGIFCGGVIMAGPAANLLALSDLTSALPDFSQSVIQRPTSPIGRSTKQAMLSGAYYQGLGAIERVVNEMAATFPNPPTVIGTGGGLGPWRDALPQHWQVVDNLVLEGILQIASHIGVS